MKQLFWAVFFSVIIVFVSVVAESSEPNEVSAPYEDSSIEVGFSQDGEPEPHLRAIAKDGRVTLFEIAENATSPTEGDAGREMQPRVYMKRMRQGIEQEGFFSAPQARPKGRCKDKYVIRITQGQRTRERRGCSNQSNDRFAAFAQMVFRDSFLSYRQRMPASSD